MTIYYLFTCGAISRPPQYVSGVQRRFDCYDAHTELFSESSAIESADPWDLLVRERSLPGPTITEFDRNRMNYQSFVRQFTACNAKKTHTDHMRLLFLLQHCKPDVRDNIERDKLGPTLGYQLAWQTLFERHGPLQVIAQCFEQHLETALEAGGCQGVPLPPKNFACSPQRPPKNFPRDVMPLH